MHYFQSVYPTSHSAPKMRFDSLLRLWRINPYLLTYLLDLYGRDAVSDTLFAKRFGALIQLDGLAT